MPTSCTGTRAPTGSSWAPATRVTAAVATTIFGCSTTSGSALAVGGRRAEGGPAPTAGATPDFIGTLDLTKAGVSERITHIETFSMVGTCHDHLKLNASDVLDVGDGQLNPTFAGADQWGKGDAVRVEGGEGDRLTLAGGNWHEVEDVKNVPDNYDVFARQTSAGVAYVVVDEDVHGHLA